MRHHILCSLFPVPYSPCLRICGKCRAALRPAADAPRPPALFVAYPVSLFAAQAFACALCEPFQGVAHLWRCGVHRWLRNGVTGETGETGGTSKDMCLRAKLGIQTRNSELETRSPEPCMRKAREGCGGIPRALTCKHIPHTHATRKLDTRNSATITPAAVRPRGSVHYNFLRMPLRDSPVFDTMPTHKKEVVR